MNNFSSFSFFISNLSIMFNLRSHELVEMISILSNKDMSKVMEFIAPKLFRLIAKRLEKVTRYEAEQSLIELFAIAK